MTLNSELDKVKTTITLSLATKNRLRKIKGSQSYEDMINYLLRVRNQVANSSENYLEIQKFKRTSGLYSFKNYKVLFTYNHYNNSPNFQFEINIDTIKKDGEKTSVNQLYEEISKETGRNIIEVEYLVYFELLQKAIQTDIESLFKHNSRFEDYFAWKEEFRILNLPDKSFDEDVMEKLNSYQSKKKEKDK